MTITDEQKQVIKSTAPLLKANGKEITSIFYRHLFSDHPELLNLFNQTNQKVGTQPLALANTIYFAAENIDNLEVLMPQVRIIAHKHRALTIQPEHYPIVGEYLLRAIAEFLGDKATPTILDDWLAVYDTIASIFIDVEKQMYDDLGNDERDKGFIPFTIVKKEMIATGPIISMTLERRDGGRMHDYHPGQYIIIRVKKYGYFQNRHYSLIEPFDGKFYRVAIKQENENDPKGVVSNEIIDNYQEEDTVLVTLPAGDFAVVKDTKHSLFIAGGIGIVALTAMIQELSKQGKSDSVTLIHCVSTEGHAAFADNMRTILHRDQYLLFTRSNRLSKEVVQSKLKPDTHVYMCGSVPFMNIIEGYLTECDHPESHIHIEAFQPRLSVVKDAVKDESTTKVF